MKAPLYTQEGKEKGQVEISDKIFGLPWNADLVNQVVLSMRSSARKSLADTKGRGEVRGGGKKPWKQKGTGRSRHGSSRSPIWKGGGVTHGPLSEKSYDRKVNKKMKAKAFLTILSQKLREGELVFIDSLSLADKKTKSAQGVVNSLASMKGYEAIAYKKGSRALIALPEYNKDLALSFRNLPAISVEEFRNVSPVDLLTYKFLVIAKPEMALQTLEARAK